MTTNLSGFVSLAVCLVLFTSFGPEGEALRHFVEHAPLTRVHQYVFGVLAMENEPVDPRL